MSTDLVLPGAVSETGLDLPADLSFEEWERVGGVLGRIGRAHQWWVGDWLNYGERAYGEKYAQAMNVLGLEYSTVSNYAWVAKAVESSVRTETLSWSHHLEVATLNRDEQVQWLTAAASQGWTHRDLKQAVRERKAIDPPPLPEGQYSVIYADPPWPYDKGFVSYPGEETETQRRQEKPLPYPSMSLEEIHALPVSTLAAPDCVLFLWTTNRFLPDAFSVLDAWGFEYRQTLIWHKTGNPSPFGGTVAPNHAEFLLVGMRGRFEFRSRLTSSVIPIPKPYSHSTKPGQFQNWIEHIVAKDAPKIELFARGPHTKVAWSRWGNEA